MKIAMYDLEGHLLEVFEVDTVRDLERELNYNQGSINNCLHGLAISVNNRQFKRFPEKRKIHNKIGDISEITTTHLKPVHKYYKGVYICSYDSIRTASKRNGLFDANINKCCNGIYNSAGGFEWKYAV
jgi:hypothetical protein